MELLRGAMPLPSPWRRRLRGGVSPKSRPLDDLLLEPSHEMKNSFVFYYLRVTQKNGHQAWTSPIWITE